MWKSATFITIGNTKTTRLLTIICHVYVGNFSEVLKTFNFFCVFVFFFLDNVAKHIIYIWLMQNWISIQGGLKNSAYVMNVLDRIRNLSLRIRVKIGVKYLTTLNYPYVLNFQPFMQSLLLHLMFLRGLMMVHRIFEPFENDTK